MYARKASRSPSAGAVHQKITVFLTTLRPVRLKIEASLIPNLFSVSPLTPHFSKGGWGYGQHIEKFEEIPSSLSGGKSNRTGRDFGNELRLQLYRSQSCEKR